MKWHIKKIVPLLTTTLLVALSQLSARNVDCSGFGCDLPSCSTYNDCGWTFYADVLYWKARGSNITYNSDYLFGFKQEATIESAFSDSGTVFPSEIAFDFLQEKRTRNKSLRFKDDLGFRLGLAYFVPCSCWDFGINWTHFHTKAHGKESPIKKGVLGEVQQEFSYKNKTKWDLDLNYGDIELGRQFCVDDCLSLKVTAGVRWASICQDYESFAKFEFVSDDDIATVISNQDFSVMLNRQQNLFFVGELIDEALDIFKIHEKHDFVGAGPRIGVDLEWSLYCGWSLFGSAAFSYIFGYSEHDVCDCILPFDRREQDVQALAIDEMQPIGLSTLTAEQILAESTTYKRDLHLQANRPMTDLAVGLRWVPMMKCCPYLLSFQLSFEHHALYGQKHAHFNDLQTPLLNCTSTLAVYGMAFSTNLSF